MRNQAIQRLEGLVGTWRTTLRNAWFLDPPDQEVPGSTDVTRLHDAFLVVRWTIAGDDEQPASDMVLVLGHSDAQDAYTALYHDERGVGRVFAMTFDESGDASPGTSRWTLTRQDPDMHQRFVADVEADRITGRWEASEDQGATWRKDYDLIFERK